MRKVSLPRRVKLLMPAEVGRHVVPVPDLETAAQILKGNTMYYDRRWERDFSNRRSDTRHKRTWLILVLLVVPLLAAAVSVWIATQVEDMREHLKMGVGAFP